MQKINYFALLEELSVLCSRAVFLAAESNRSQLQKALSEISSIENQATNKLCELENALFKDFLPPLERRSIAEAGHRLCKVISHSAQILGKRAQRASYDRRPREPDVCITLSELLEESVMMIKKIKKPNQMPKIKEFREILNKARISSRSTQKKQNSTALLLSELREDISDCFDGIIEIMLCNI